MSARTCKCRLQSRLASSSAWTLLDQLRPTSSSFISQMQIKHNNKPNHILAHQ